MHGAQPCLCTGTEPKYGILPAPEVALASSESPFLSSSSPGLTHIEDVQGQPVEKGVADQFGKEQTQRELNYSLGNTREGTMERGSRDPQSSGGPPGG